MRRLLLILLGSIVVLRADTTPNLIWTGDPILYGGFFYAASSTSTGFEVNTSCFDGAEPGCDASFEVGRSFTVTSPGAFVLSINAMVGGEAFSCFPNRCAPEAFLSMSYSGTNSFDGSIAGSPGPSGSGSETTTFDTADDLGCLEVGSTCNAYVNLASAESEIVDLGLTDNELDVFYIVSGSSGTGDINVGSDFNFSLVPTPEPRGTIVLLAVVFLGILLLNARRAAHSSGADSRLH